MCIRIRICFFFLSTILRHSFTDAAQRARAHIIILCVQVSRRKQFKYYTTNFNLNFYNTPFWVLYFVHFSFLVVLLRQHISRVFFFQNCNKITYNFIYHKIHFQIIFATIIVKAHYSHTPYYHVTSI